MVTQRKTARQPVAENAIMAKKRPQVSLEPYQVRGDGKLRRAFQRNTHIDVPQFTVVRNIFRGDL
jgi:hypothetical protein